MQDIKRRIKSIRGIEHVTNAMKLVSAAKLRKAKSIFEKTTKNFDFITETIESVFNNSTEVPEQYLPGQRDINKTCYIIMTSNRGLCGSYNTNIIKETEKEIKNDPESPFLITIGSKGRDYFEKRGHHIIGEYLLPPEQITFLEAREISKPVISMYNEGEIDEVKLVYTSFISSLEQKAKCLTLLPFQISGGEDADQRKKETEYEPSPEEVFHYLVQKYIEIHVYGAIIESAACEHAARRIAMENATDNAREMLEDLSLFFNRARQAAITEEIIEIVAGSEAQK
jgi:F-type H+-transporting ATPase subunit gamma